MRIPSMLHSSEIRNHFSGNDAHDLHGIIGYSKHINVVGDNGKKYEAWYDHDRWSNGVIRLKRIK